ncbi:DUF6786 family protein [Flammeovirga sp. EKP202]|uniref:DUF6786 family protein n=1 Tax=Flammeovirga sp. EKP202 TaxID=2770592 RepID=UPI00165F7C6F|nr:DUF6786 family protein [Flammeovirga sp. EKP202]MBD0400274.1 hypothetical protein [Flammeovirga sp. EKP202]
MNYFIKTIFIMGLTASLSCDNKQELQKGSFGYDVSFLKDHQSTIVLENSTGKSKVAIVPAYQGRIMSSSAQGDNGNSYGWLNYEAIASKELQEKINVYGGEDRFWLGPEGGQYSIFFDPKTEFTFDNWRTPKEIDTEGFDVIAQSSSKAVFEKEMKLTNYSGFPFHILVNREVSIFERSEIEEKLALDLSNMEVDFVGFESVNTIKNIGEQAWNKESGLLSVWILGMLKPTDETVIMVPFKTSPAYQSYFGTIPSDKLKVSDELILFKGDGTHRGKIGLRPEHTVPLLGSYDAEKGVLTVVQFSFNNDQDYVNSMWELQDEPYAGDAVNTYNDGPLENGDQLGPFYELESSSPAKALGVNDSVIHHHVTYHFEGKEEDLNKISLKLFKSDLKGIKI